MNRHPVAAASAFLCAALSGGLSATAALAQDMPSGMEEPRPSSGNRLERVEIQSRQQSDTELRRRASVAKQIYGREELDKYGDTNVSDVLKRLPGVNVQGGAPRMRGLGAGYTQILINGEPAPPGFSMDNLNPAQVERIEVSKGPTAEHSAQAIAGTINIILKDAPRQSQRDLRLGMGYNYDEPRPSFTATYGERFGNLSMVLPVSGFQWRVRNESEGERDTKDELKQRLHVTSQSAETGWGGGVNFGPRLNWKLADDETLAWQSFLQRNEWNNRGRTVTDLLAGETPPSLDDSYLNTGSWQMLRSNLHWTKRFEEGQRLELKLGGQTSRARYTTDLDGLGGKKPLQRHTDGDNKDRGLTQSGKYSQSLGDSHGLTLGWDLEYRRRDEVRSVTQDGRDLLPDFEGRPFEAQVKRTAFFVQDEWEISPQWSTYFGLRTERIVTTSQLSRDGRTQDLRNSSHVLTPLWHLNYKIDPKGRDMIRASLTRSYKAPELQALMARPSVNTTYPLSKPNPETAPDRIGNPNLKPELATGLDIAYEKYFTGGGLFSVSLFHRRIKDLIRNDVFLEDVSWATVQRYVSRPVNLAGARTSGIELELKGRAGELMPALFDPSTNLNLRGSLSFYRSKVEGLPGPDNRLDSQHPYAVNLGFDYKLKSLPLTLGAGLVYMPGYGTQQTPTQLQEVSRSRSLDVFAQYMFSRQYSLRLSANNVAALDPVTDVIYSDGQRTHNQRFGRTFFAANLEMKF
ncbi:TonB-dependent receptor [Roseateles sp. DAIF2]|uniref:TonB-dependent receptor plug domain-containing protein n=1 Tax=Roseateles sp. DAIF2 TaxID=2714952 RepID=UPI0018A2853D|nr:TonB-dependent receptor [Roseateles sp. DAIF2]QPF74977.1 TonB-dependent receptor [Roseateles sp. DAIF2]